MTMDYKLPSSNMEENMCLENMEYLKPWDVVKFVIGSREDLNRAKEIIERFRLCEKAIVYFSPVFGKIEPEETLNFMKENKLNKSQVPDSASIKLYGTLTRQAYRRKYYGNR